MSEDKKPEQNGPPKPLNQNHLIENTRGGHEGGRSRLTRFRPRRDRDHTRQPNDQNAGEHDGNLGEGNPPICEGMRGRAGGLIRDDRDDSGRTHRGEDTINDKLAAMSGNTYDLPPKDGSEQKFSSRCRLYVGELAEITVEEVIEMFKKYGEINECFVNAEKMFAFVRLDYRDNAERAKRELDGTMRKNRALKVRFAPVGAAIKVKNLTRWVTNELLEYAFSVFGKIERAQILVDDCGNSLKKGIVEFASKSTALLAVQKCAEGCFFLTRSFRPVIVECFDVIDDVDGFSEKSITRIPQEYIKSRKYGPRLALSESSFEFDFGTRWKELHNVYKQKKEALKRELKLEEKKLKSRVDFLQYEHETKMLREALKRRKQKMEHDVNKRRKIGMQHQEEEQLQNHQMEMAERGGQTEVSKLLL